MEGRSVGAVSLCLALYPWPVCSPDACWPAPPQTMLALGRDPAGMHLCTDGKPLYDELIFAALWARTVTALSYIFDHCPEDQPVRWWQVIAMGGRGFFG